MIAVWAEVRSQLQPLAELQGSFFTSERVDIEAYQRLGAILAGFTDDILRTYSVGDLRGVLAFAALTHPSGLNSLVKPPIPEEGYAEKPAVFTHVDFQETRHKILGPDGFLVQVLRRFQEETCRVERSKLLVQETAPVSVGFSVPLSQPEGA